MISVKSIDKQGKIAVIQGMQIPRFDGCEWDFAICLEASGWFSVNEITSGLRISLEDSEVEAVTTARLKLAARTPEQIEAARALIAQHVAEIAFQEALAMAAALS